MPAPDYISLYVRQFARRAQMVRMVVGDEVLRGVDIGCSVNTLRYQCVKLFDFRLFLLAGRVQVGILSRDR